MNANANGDNVMWKVTYEIESIFYGDLRETLLIAATDAIDAKRKCLALIGRSFDARVVRVERYK